MDATGPQKKKLSMLQLTMMIWSLTSGGPFGLEAAVQSGGVMYTLLGFILTPVIFSIPQSLMCSELGCMMPYVYLSLRTWRWALCLNILDVTMDR